MRQCKRVVAAVFMTTAAFSALVPQAVAASMPWETGGRSAATTHHVVPAAAGDGGIVGLLCAGGCPQ
ncbi:hypothetical protein SAM40697_0487 [Streptomyces ambofaciens]|uniref:Secreted protein n=1 Tax=Streptomyces ambofaciens TaxID=1889 RepID=A0ABN4P244_STRAM|nr:hypothetical protein [Streptomyces ambofaciens]ANB04449.1 hypothetical protein SAM40697_0487 [Streptomyces ambofaciens]